MNQAPFPAGTLVGPAPSLASGNQPFVISPVTPIRQGAARVLDVMRTTTAPVTVVAEVDMSRLKHLYEEAKPKFERDMGIRLTYTPFFARATVKALQAHPIMNSTFTPMGYVVPRYVNLGIATQTPGVVLIPTITNAQSKTVAQLAREIQSIGEKARVGKLEVGPDSATFVMTNTGRYGATLFGTPTIKPPNVGILAFETIQKRPVATSDDRVEVRPMMYLALTADHRAVDGSHMAAFLTEVKRCLETLSF